MENQPKRLIIHILEFAALFALSAFLLRLGLGYLQEIWWMLLIIAGIVIGGRILYQLWRRNRWM